MLKSWFRNLRMKKYSSTLPTGLLPLRKIRSALILLDGTDPGCLKFSERIETFMRAHGIAVSFIYTDLRKIGKDTTVYACGHEVINRCDVDWTGMPDRKGKGRLFSSDVDLFADLTGSDDFTCRFISAVARAGFKIGTVAYPGNPFDLVIADQANAAGPPARPEEGTPATMSKIEAMFDFLNRIV